MGHFHAPRAYGLSEKAFLGTRAAPGIPSELWVLRTNPIGDILAIGASSSRIAAIDVNGASIYSDDHGATWTQGTGPGVTLTGNPGGIAFHGGTWVAVFAENVIGNVVYNSSDGITWTKGQTLNGLIGCCAVAYGNGIFVIVLNNSSQNVSVYTSPDGITWTAQPSATTPSLGSLDTISLIFDGNDFVIPFWVSNASASVWTQSNPPGFSGNVDSLANDGNTLYVAADNSNPPDVQSSPSSTWNGTVIAQPLSGGANASVNSVAFGNGLWCLVGFTNTGLFPQAATSTDLITFALEDLKLGNSDGPRGVAYLTNTFICWSFNGQISTRT